MVSSGMAAVGYEYINMDDCWLAETRDAQGNLQPDPEVLSSIISLYNSLLSAFHLESKPSQITFIAKV